MRAIEAVIFDMDGTLVDSEGVSRRAWSLAADELGVDLPDAFIDTLMGRNSRACNSLVVEHLGGNEALAQRVVDMHLELFLKLAETDLKLKPGAHEALEALRSVGLPLAVATSTARVRALPRLERFSLTSYFTSITCGNEVANGKPAPDIFIESARRIGVDPAACAVIEDSHNGVRSGHAAGAQVFMVPDLMAPTPEVESLCAAVLSSLHELPEAILG